MGQTMKRATTSLNSNEDEQRNLFKRFFLPLSIMNWTNSWALPGGEANFFSFFEVLDGRKTTKNLQKKRHSFPESGKENDLRKKQNPFFPHFLKECTRKLHDLFPFKTVGGTSEKFHSSRKIVCEDVYDWCIFIAVWWRGPNLLCKNISKTGASRLKFELWQQ